MAIGAIVLPMVQAKDKPENEVKFNAKFKTFSFEGNITDIVYLEGKEYKPVNIFDGNLSEEKIYIGGPVIEFLKVTIETPPTESDLAKNKLNAAKANEAKIGDEYNKVLNEMLARARTMEHDDSSTNNDQKNLGEYQSKLNELKLKLDESSRDTYNETQRMYAAVEAGSKAVNLNNGKPKSSVEPPKPKYEPLA
ncbi:MAG: hypothetical protein EBS00_06385, partial [Verrucomicrobia bacterium]|nr:hypothetical protein [Verrucomicrobiota bacterium]